MSELERLALSSTASTAKEGKGKDKDKKKAQAQADKQVQEAQGGLSEKQAAKRQALTERALTMLKERIEQAGAPVR